MEAKGKLRSCAWLQLILYNQIIVEFIETAKK
jgi:hypothetical protein